MKSFKFLVKRQETDYGYVWIDYTIGHNTKTCASLKLATTCELLSNISDMQIFEGTFIEFRETVINHPRMCWYANFRKPLIHVIHFYSRGWRHWQLRGDHDYFRYNRRRIKKEQKLRIYYEIV
jgi:hypothetical protein